MFLLNRNCLFNLLKKYIIRYITLFDKILIFIVYDYMIEQEVLSNA